jgi:predicted nucleic acid-binding protein
MSLTIDASVFIAASRTEEPGYRASRQFLLQARAQGMELFCPALALPECAAAITRPTGDSGLAEELISLIESFPGLQLVPLDIPLARRASQAGIDLRVRGADSVYTSVAQIFDADLITWDREVLERVSGAVTTMTPDEWLAQSVPAE